MNSPHPETEIDSSPAGDEQQDLLQYYGLSADPFDNVGDVFLLTPKLEKLLRLLNYLTRFSHKAIVITAEAGIGKSQVAQQFLSGLEEGRDYCQIDGLADDTPAQMLHEIAEQCGLSELESAGVEELRADLDRYARDLLEDGRSCVIVIDDADLLNTRVLSELYDLVKPQEGQIGPWHLVLFGRPVLEHNLSRNEQIQEDSRHLFHYQLSRFSYKECCQYLQICFSRSGDQAKIPYDKGDYLRIYQASGGVPQAIISEARVVLEEGVDRLLARNSAPKWLVSSAVACSLVAVVLAGAYIWQQPGTSEPSSAQIASTHGITQVVGTIDRALDTVGDFEPDNDGQQSGPSEQVEVADIEVPAAETSIDTNDASPQEGSNSGPGAEPSLTIAATEVETATASDASDEFAGGGVTDTGIADDTGTLEPAVAAIDVAAPKTATGKPAAGETQVSTIRASGNSEAQARVEQEATSAKPVEPEVVASESAYTPFSSSESAILTWAANDYTLQLLGARTEKQVLDFMAPASELEGLQYFQTTLKGAPWYVVVFGNYPSRADAIAASKNLPGSLGKTSPWIRRVKGIQQILQERVEAPQVSQH